MEKANIFTGFNSIFATKLRELMEYNKTTQKELSEVIGTTRQAISQYADGSVQPNVEKLYKISSFFGVSADYLLGLTTSKSKDMEKQAICDYIGLSDLAVEKLRIFKEKNMFRWWLYIVNAMIEYSDFEYIIACMTDYATSKDDYTITPTTNTASIRLKEKDIILFSIQSSITQMLSHFSDGLGFNRKKDLRFAYGRYLAYKDGHIDIKKLRELLDDSGLDVDEFIADAERNNI